MDKLEAERSNTYSDINNPIDKQNRKVKIERLIVKCKNAFNNLIETNKEPLNKLEQRFETVTNKHGKTIAADQLYNCSIAEKDTAKQYASHLLKSGSHLTYSKISSQCQLQ